ncbi:LysR substrate-binding domain-containing protein [Paractinoplanes atraurantiacus]|uniref:LysR substrate binding domain-containing protein n=1 Tax=Paractinoplanes atraurantiacus TaxID=1036182 RepID=A0A285K9T3_9ACTN|nr:LysR substrate-binding domain-containing protein [Actinoplanes atraurantiacus]SNY68983.1 LysR substrate binding domain-containing protein [Actinoplanes atraurantiacus]
MTLAAARDIVDRHDRLRRDRAGLLDPSSGTVRLAFLQDFVTIPPGFGFRQLVDDLFAAAGVTPRVAFEIGDLATIEGLVGAGLGVALVPEPFVGASGTIGLGLAAPGAERVVGLTWRTDRRLGPAASRFRDFVEREALYGLTED